MHGIMRCKATDLLRAVTDGLFGEMAPPANSAEGCSCKEAERALNQRRPRLDFFGLCRDRQPKRSKRAARWGLKFGCSKKEGRPVQESSSTCCRCTCAGNAAGADAAGAEEPAEEATALAEPERDEGAIEEAARDEHGGIYATAPAAGASAQGFVFAAPFLEMQWSRTHQQEDFEEAARRARAREIEQGVEVPANFRSSSPCSAASSVRRVQLLCPASEEAAGDAQAPRRLQLVCPPDLSVESIRALFQNHVTLRSCPLDMVPGCHTQVDFIHCLVPDLLTITNCSFYWGKMDRYEAERLLEGKPEGTFLLRDSAQEEFLFSVSFRKYGRSLHARIEQWNHKFSFDSHDPGVYTSDTVYGLIEHYKDPSSCMFFEPLLTWPLHRKFVFPLQHLSRSVIAGRATYDNINQLQLPKSLKTYLKEYHYRQKVRVERFEEDVQLFELRNGPAS